MQGAYPSKMADVFCYYKKFFIHWGTELLSFGREQAVGVILAALILWFQIEKGLIPAKDAALTAKATIFWPYLALIGIYLVIHLIRTPWKLDQEQEKDITNLEAQLQQERDSAQQPDIALVWDWPEDQRQENALAGRTEKDILVHNRSNEWIYKVRVAPISLAQEMTFDEINEIAPKTQHLALARWDGRASLTTNYVYFFGKDENEQEADKKHWVYKKTHNTGFSAYFLKIPVTVTYECKGTIWETVFDFNYNSGEESAFVRKSGRRVPTSQALGQQTCL